MQLPESLDEKEYTPYISAPLSSYEYAKTYRECIEPQLISVLESLNIDFFFTLTQLNVQINSELLVAPLIVVYTTSTGVAVVKALLDRVWETNNFSEFLVCITRGTYVDAVDHDVPFDTDMYTSPHENWKCGMSIGFYSKSATSGAIFENSREEYAALTCAHLFRPHESKCVGLQVTQPSYEDFCLYYTQAESHKRTCEKELQRAGTEEARLEIEADLHQITKILEELNQYVHTTADKYQKDAQLATVIKASYQVIDYNGRRCLRDYALLNIFDRLPKKHKRSDKLPIKDFLRDVVWENDATSIDELQWDIRVKKRGRSTAVTYGIIAGVHGIMKSSEGGPRREFWALPEAFSTSLYEFSSQGDSDALVWTDKGVAVGVIIAGWTATFENPPAMAVILPNGYWGTKNIPFFRHEDGSIDFTGLLQFAVSRPLSLIESLRMVTDHTGDEYKLWVA